MADERDYTAGVPTEPPEGMLDWLASRGALLKNVIIYSCDYVSDEETGKKRKMVLCKCTACKSQFHEEYISNGGCGTHIYTSAPFGFLNGLTKENVISGDTTMCPQCTAPASVWHIDAIRGEFGRQIEDVYPMSVHRINGLVYLLSWRIAKWADKCGDIKIEIKPYEGYAFDGRKAVKIVGYNRWYSYRYTGKWEKRVACVDTYGKAKYVFPFSPDILSDTCLENSKLDMFEKDAGEAALVTYLRIYQKHKNVENIVMQGASALLSDMIDATQHKNYCRRGYTGNIENINWKAKRPCEMFGLNKDEYKLCISHKWSLSHLNIYVFGKEHGIMLSPADVSLVKNFGLMTFKYMVEFERPRNVSVMRCIRYLDKQRVKYNQNLTYHDLIDYWNMSRKLGDELNTDADIFPQNLKRAHDNCTDRINAAKDAKRDKEFKERYNALCGYCFEYDGLYIRPPMSAAELRAEGKALNHCVFSYADRHASGQTAILFIRHCEEPDKPYFTLELDEKNLTVRQNRGKGNCARTEEVVIFEKEWLKAINKIFKKKKARVTA